VRYHVKNGAGEELTVPTLGDLATLYQQGFLSDDDLVRAESATRWVRAGAMPALHGVRLRRRANPARVWMLFAAAAALATGIGVLLAR
jgi:hypothetical protein